jgi:hypothetical protein
MTTLAAFARQANWHSLRKLFTSYRFIISLKSIYRKAASTEASPSSTQCHHTISCHVRPFIHSAVYLSRVRSSASLFHFHYPLVSLMSSVSSLRLLPHSRIFSFNKGSLSPGYCASSRYGRQRRLHWTSSRVQPIRGGPPAGLVDSLNN